MVRNSTLCISQEPMNYFNIIRIKSFILWTIHFFKLIQMNAKA